jgi:hypothetical protein
MVTLQQIQNRRAEAEQEVARLQGLLTNKQTEVADLTAAERVFGMLDDDAKRPTSGTASGYKAQTPVGRAFADTGTEPTMPEMILAVLKTAHAEGHKSLTSREIAEAMKAEFKLPLDDDRVSSTIWRLWKADRLRKIKQGVYALPKERPASDKPVEGTPAGLDDNPAQGGEARPGGGP